MESLQAIARHDVRPESPIVVAVDTAATREAHGKTEKVYERHYFLCRGSDLDGIPGGSLQKVTIHSLFHQENKTYFAAADREGSDMKVYVVIYPTRTYSTGFGSHLFSDISPEDRAFIRAVRRRYPDRTVAIKVPLHDTKLFEHIKGYLDGEHETKKYHEEKKAVAEAHAAAKSPTKPSRSLLQFDSKYLSNMKSIFASCMTRPNKQDYGYLIYKTFGLNLGVRLIFMTMSVMKGELPLVRAILSTTWYQLQDAVFTVFGQTYMKFLGKMTGMVRIYNSYFGDLFFVYFQLCGFEFLNRLVLGPLGENPLVYTWRGMGLIFLNIMQGMLSGGPLIPAINQMRKVGAINHNTMMHFYQLSSLTMQFGLFASFGYQTFYSILTGAILVLSWSSYFIFSTLYKDPEFEHLEGEHAMARMDALALRCAS
jgi:hypothetical protein